MTPRRKQPDQPARILDAFSAWLSAVPGRKVSLAYSEADGWAATLHEGTERTSGGKSLVDAAAQVAVVCVCETAGGA